jgi:cellulose synthase/poly-beta-1,6-N-acetylglucosamine synthase-like glycosyltransferase
MNCPPVSIVVPCKGSERTILATVEALLNQDYPALEEVILVGSTGDSTWGALSDVKDARLIILEHETTRAHRDPNVKRDMGIQKSRGEIVALADSDIVMSRTWLSHAVELLAEDADMVAGGMKAITDDFWGRYVDRNRLAAKTPRVPVSYTVTRANFGRRGRKPPITANVIFGRHIYENCSMDTGWDYGYEDYEWFWRVVKGGYRVLFSCELAGYHHHRRSLRSLMREYLRAGQGCAQFIRIHSDSGLARKRLIQAIILPCAALAAVTAAWFTIQSGRAAFTMAVFGSMLAAAGLWEYSKTRRAEALTYPLISGVLLSVFSYGVMSRLLRKPWLR